MKVNGVFVNPSGLKFSEIGRLLQEASPCGDGAGLRIELSLAEENAFEAICGELSTGHTLSELIESAVVNKGNLPKFQLHYSSLVRVPSHDFVYTTVAA